MVDKHPWSAIPAARSSAPVLTIRLWVVIGLVLLAAAMGPLSLVVQAAHAASVAPPPASTGSGPSQGLAQLVALDFVNGIPTSVPTAKNVDPTFGINTAQQPTPLPHGPLVPMGTVSTVDTTSKQPYQISSFGFESSGQVWKVAVTMLQTPSGPVLGAEPSLLPVDLSAAQYQQENFHTSAGFQEGAPPNSAIQAHVNQWAQAFASNNGATLAQLTGDPSAQTFRGLGGFTLAQAPQILSYVPVAASGVPVVNGVTPTSPMYLRVQLALTSTHAKQYTVTNEYDVLVTGSNTAQPQIVAWGPPGSAPLTPFSNASRFG